MASACWVVVGVTRVLDFTTAQASLEEGPIAMVWAGLTMIVEGSPL